MTDQWQHHAADKMSAHAHWVADIAFTVGLFTLMIFMLGSQFMTMDLPGYYHLQHQMIISY